MIARVLVVTRSQPQWLRDECSKYCKMILAPWKVTMEYLPLSKYHGKDDAKAKQDDCLRLLQASKDKYKVALDVHGKTFSSMELSHWAKNLTEEVCFLIGGPLGFDKQTLDKCQMSLSLSSLTFPHSLAHLLIMEQLYRANTIARGGKYHK